MSGDRRDERYWVWTSYGWARRENLERLERQRAERRARRDPHELLWRSPRWQAIARAYDETGMARPSQTEAAGKLDRSDRTLARWRRELGIERWSDVHALMAAWRNRN